VVGAELALVDPSAAGIAGVRWPDAFLRHAYRASRLGERSAEPPATGSSSEQGQVQTNASMSSFKDNPFLAELRTPVPAPTTVEPEIQTPASSGDRATAVLQAPPGCSRRLSSSPDTARLGLYRGAVLHLKSSGGNASITTA
jgi:hypothetical protein